MMLLVYYIIGCIILVANLSKKAQCLPQHNVSEKEEWDSYKLRFNKIYKDKIEDKKRFNIFLDNKKYIIEQNELYEKGLVSYELEINGLSDVSDDEYMKMSRSSIFNDERLAELTYFNKLEYTNGNDIPDKIDWKKRGAVTDVKYQGLTCGACWAFGTTGALEGQHFIKNGKLVSLSEQNLIDCSKYLGNLGCDGGETIYAFTYVEDNRGIATEKSYPYKNKDDQCHYNISQLGATCRGFKIIPEGDEESLKIAVAKIGPISTSIDAPLSFKHFKANRVYYDKSCKKKKSDLGHGVLIVGYGTTKSGEDYWLVKNSWGTHWAQGGYIKMARNRDNACGIATIPSFPIV